jgi:hypothetical protein
LTFLVPDHQLSVVRKIALEEGCKSADDLLVPPSLACEHSDRAMRFILDDPAENRVRYHRLVILPTTWANVQLRELKRDTLPSLTPSSPPTPIWTVPFHVVSVALVRIISGTPHGSKLRCITIRDLAGLMAYSLFDCSYEGDYEEIIPNDVPLSEKEELEMLHAREVIGSWKMRAGEEWITRSLVDIVTNGVPYRSLPAIDT